MSPRAPETIKTVAQFREYLVGLQRSDTTLEKYTQAARSFHGYLAMRGWQIDLAPATAVEEWLTWLMTPEPGIPLVSPPTLHLQYAGVRKYLLWLRKRLPGMPAEWLEPHSLPSLVSKLPTVMSQDECMAYCRQSIFESEPYATAMLLLPFCGLRINELCALHLGDVVSRSLDDGSKAFLLHVRRGKGGHARLVPVFTGPEGAVSEALHNYLTVDRAKFPRDESALPRDERWLFPAPRTRYYSSISAKRLQDICASWRSVVGVDDLHPHMGRRHYATALLSVASQYSPPMDVLEVARYLGHRNGADTLAEHYAGVRLEHAQEWMGRIYRPQQRDYKSNEASTRPARPRGAAQAQQNGG